MGQSAYRWNGKYGKGAMKEVRRLQRVEAEARNTLTPETRRRSSARALGKSRNSQLAGAKANVMLFMVGKSMKPMTEAFRQMGEAAANAMASVSLRRKQD